MGCAYWYLLWILLYTNGEFGEGPVACNMTIHKHLLDKKLLLVMPIMKIRITMLDWCFEMLWVSTIDVIWMWACCFFESTIQCSDISTACSVGMLTRPQFGIVYLLENYTPTRKRNHS